MAQVGTADAAAIESAEHKALGYRPPPNSLSAAAKAAAVEHPDASSGASPTELAAAGRDDALRVKDEHAGTTASNGSGGATPASAIESGVAALDLGDVGRDAAQTIQSAEQKALGYRPPAGSLAAEAQAAAAKHPDGASETTALSKDELKEMAVTDAAAVELERRGGVVAETTVDVDALSAEEARKLQSEEHKMFVKFYSRPVYA
jgi:hypothetical protein